MFQNNLKFTRADCWIELQISNRERKTQHSWYHYAVTIAGDYYKVFNAVELYIFKSLKVNCSNKACSASMQSIFNNHNMTGNRAEKYCSVALNVKWQVKP